MDRYRNFRSYSFGREDIYEISLIGDDNNKIETFRGQINGESVYEVLNNFDIGWIIVCNIKPINERLGEYYISTGNSTDSEDETDYLCGYLLATVDGNNEIFINLIGVKSIFGGHNFGRNLINFLFEYCTKEEIDICTLKAVNSAVDFFKKFGFEEGGINSYDAEDKTTLMIKIFE